MNTQDSNEFTAPGASWADRAVNGVILVSVFTLAFSAASALRG